MAKNKPFISELEGLHYDILEDFISKGSVGDMDPEMVLYLEQLKFIQSRLHRVDSPNNVIKSLIAFFPDLNIVTATSRFNDALSFFHLDKESNNDAWRNLLFEIGMKAVSVIVQTSKTSKELLELIKALKDLHHLKGLHLPDKQELPHGLLDEKIEIHSLTPSDVGLPEANRATLAAQIDSMPLREDEKLKIKVDAGVIPREIFNPNEQTKD